MVNNSFFNLSIVVSLSAMPAGEGFCLAMLRNSSYKCSIQYIFSRVLLFKFTTKA